MAWEIVERRLGRAGDPKRRAARQRAWDRRYGEGAWCVGYQVDGEFVASDEAFLRVYAPSYAAYFAAHPDDALELAALAKSLRNPHAAATGAVDLQVPAVLMALERLGLELTGRERVDIGSWRGEASPPISVRLSPLQIPVLGGERSLESYWQRAKRLAVWRA